MATLKLHYDGWLTLPAGLRDLLDLKTGDHLQAELVDGAIVLRPTHGKRMPAEPEPAAAMPVVATTAAADAVAAPLKRPRGRPRKVQADPSQAELLPGLEVLAPPRRKPGRPRKAHVEGSCVEAIEKTGGQEEACASGEEAAGPETRAPHSGEASSGEARSRKTRSSHPHSAAPRPAP